MEGRENIFSSVSRSQFVAIGLSKQKIENRSKDKVFMAKMNFE